MQNLHIILFLVLVGLGSAFVQRVSGFGLGIFAMLFLPAFLPSIQVSATVACLFSCGTSSYNAIKYRKNISFRTAIPMLTASLLTIPAAVYLSSMVSQGIFEILLGTLLILLSIFFMFSGNKIQLNSSIKNGLIAGGISGILNGMFSTGGPPAVIYVSSSLNDKMSYFSTIQFFFCITNLYATATRAISGILTPQILIYGAVGFMGCLLGDLLGRVVFDKIDEKIFVKIIYIGMILSGILMIF